MAEYKVLITFKSEDTKDISELYRGGQGTQALVQQIYELATKARDKGFDLKWQEGSEVT